MQNHLPTTGRRARASRVAVLSLATIVGGATFAACAEEPSMSPSAARAGYDEPGVHRQYGTPITLGQGKARSYVVLKGDEALEVGIALDERAMDGLPAHGHGDGPHGNFVEYIVPMPAQNATPYKFVELDWNPAGHGMPYDEAHFDFHFYTITKAERDAIDPSLTGPQQYMAKSANFPGGAPQRYVALAPPGEPVMAVPRMGVHWVDMASPELQALLGNPAGYRDFTTTFIQGSWDGQWIFAEPMITRSFILSRKTGAQRDTLVTLPARTQAGAPVGYPGAYRILYDEQAKEYRIALTQLDG